MKKVLFAFVALLTVGLVACGGNASTEATTDSTAVAVDSVKADSVAAPAVVDSVTTK